MKPTDFLPEVGHPVAYYPRLAQAVGDVKSGLLLCQLIYWSDKGKAPDGWIYKSQEELKLETGLSRREQERARRVLRDSGVLHERYKRLEHRLYFRVDHHALAAYWATHIESPSAASPTSEIDYAECTNTPVADAQTRLSSVAEVAARITESTTPEKTNKEKITKEGERVGTRLSAPRAPTPISKKSSTTSQKPHWAALEKEPLFLPLYKLCNVRFEFMSVRNRRKFKKALESLQSDGITANDLEVFGQEWEYYWRYEKNNGRAPTPSEVCECWLEVVPPLHAAQTPAPGDYERKAIEIGGTEIENVPLPNSVEAREPFRDEENTVALAASETVMEEHFVPECPQVKEEENYRRCMAACHQVLMTLDASELQFREMVAVDSLGSLERERYEAEKEAGKEIAEMPHGLRRTLLTSVLVQIARDYSEEALTAWDAQPGDISLIPDVLDFLTDQSPNMEDIRK